MQTITCQSSLVRRSTGCGAVGFSRRTQLLSNLIPTLPILPIVQTITAKSTRQTLKNVKKTATKQAKKAVSSVKGGSNLGSTWYGPDRPKFLGELSSAHGYPQDAGRAALRASRGSNQYGFGSCADLAWMFMSHHLISVLSSLRAQAPSAMARPPPT